VTPALRSLGRGLSVLQGPLWQTNATLLEAAGDVVLVDPAQFPDELAVLRAAVDALRPERLWLLITHADFDHVQGIPVFPEGTVVTDAETAERLIDGRAAEGLRAAGRDFGADWDDTLRADRIIGFGEPERLGGLELVAIDAAGHQDHGTAFAFPDLGVLAAGDYLSAITYPFCIHGVAEARATTERLLAAIEQHAIGVIIPGHGPVHDGATATRIGTEDVRYLAALEAAASEAAARQLPPAFALLHVFGVEPPRANTDDFEMYDLRGWNARAALKSVGISA
jgi:glyoxylase-like metal-dependent hydrolase (beta-lactamase superfamily II)